MNCAQCSARWQFFSVNVASKFTGSTARATSDGAAALLAFGTRTAAITAVAAGTSTTATTPTATAAVFAVAAGFTRLVTAAALRTRLATFFVARIAMLEGLAAATILAVETATAATAAAPMPAASALVTVAIIVAPVAATGGGGSLGGLGAAEKAFQPAEEAAGFFLRGRRLDARAALRTIGTLRALRAFVARIAGLVRLFVAGLELAFVAARLAGIEGFASLTIFAAVANFAAFATVALGAERRALFAALRLGGATARGRRLPADCGTTGILGRKDFQRRFFRRRGGPIERKQVGGRGLGSGRVMHGRRRHVGRRLHGRRCGCDIGGRRGGRCGDGSGSPFDPLDGFRAGRFGVGGLGSRLVGAGRVHGGFAGERVYIFALRSDDLEGAGFVAARGGGAGGAGRGGRGAFAAGETGTAVRAKDAEAGVFAGARGAGRRGRRTGLVVI